MKLPLHSPDEKSFAPDDSEANRLGEILHQTEGSVVDPNPHGSAFIWLSWIRIHIGTADPDMVYFSCKIFTFIDLKVWPGSGFGSRSASIRIGVSH